MISLQDIVSFFRHPTVSWVMTIILALVVMWIYGVFVRAANNRRWKQNLKLHMPEVYRDEVNERDGQISDLTKEVERLSEVLNQQTTAVRAAKVMINKVGEIL